MKFFLIFMVSILSASAFAKKTGSAVSEIKFEDADLGKGRNPASASSLTPASTAGSYWCSGYLQFPRSMPLFANNQCDLSKPVTPIVLPPDGAYNMDRYMVCCISRL